MKNITNSELSARYGFHWRIEHQPGVLEFDAGSARGLSNLARVHQFQVVQRLGTSDDSWAFSNLDAAVQSAADMNRDRVSDNLTQIQSMLKNSQNQSWLSQIRTAVSRTRQKLFTDARALVDRMEQWLADYTWEKVTVVELDPGLTVRITADLLDLGDQVWFAYTDQGRDRQPGIVAGKVSLVEFGVRGGCRYDVSCDDGEVRHLRVTGSGEHELLRTSLYAEEWFTSEAEARAHMMNWAQSVRDSVAEWLCPD